MNRFYTLILLLSMAIAVQGQQKQTLLVLNKADHTLTFIDPANMTTLKTIKTGEGPHEICVSDDGKTAFVANYGAQKPNNSISVIDVAEQKEIRTVDLGALWRPHGMVFKNGKLYVTAEVNRIVFRYDPITNKIDWMTGHGRSLSHMLTLSPDGKKIYTADIYSNSVTILHVGAPPTPEFIKHIDVGPKPEAIEITPDGKEVWVGQNDDGRITVINTISNKAEEQIEIGKMPIRIKFTSDGKLALVSDAAANELVIVDVKTKTITKRIKMDGVPVGIVISKDNRYAYVALTQLNIIRKIDLQHFKEVAQVSTGANPDGIALSYLP